MQPEAFLVGIKNDFIWSFKLHLLYTDLKMALQSFPDSECTWLSDGYNVHKVYMVSTYSLYMLFNTGSGLIA